MVEFDIVTDADGKLKADNVTAPGGGPCTGPRRQRKEKKPADASAAPVAAVSEKPTKKKQPAAAASTNGGKKKNGKKPQDQPWHDILKAEVKEFLTSKGIRHATGTVDVAIDKQRIKLGTRGYVSMAHADGILAEGTFAANEDGVITMTWEHVLKFSDGEWKGASADGVIGSFTLTDGELSPALLDVRSVIGVYVCIYSILSLTLSTFLRPPRQHRCGCR